MTAEEAKPAEGAASKDKWVDIVSAIVLAIASLMAAWNGYEATRWNGRQSEATNQMLAAQVAATRAGNTGEQRQLIDIFAFSSWLNAMLVGDQETADFYQSHFRAEFGQIFDAWLATDPLTNPDAPINPFAMPGYVLEDLRRAAEFEQSASDFAEQSREANTIGSNYIRNTLFISVSLFFAGLARTFERRAAHILMLTVAGMMLLIGIANALRWPIA